MEDGEDAEPQKKRGNGRSPSKVKGEARAGARRALSPKKRAIQFVMSCRHNCLMKMNERVERLFPQSRQHATISCLLS